MATGFCQFWLPLAKIFVIFGYKVFLNLTTLFGYLLLLYWSRILNSGRYQGRAFSFLCRKAAVEVIN